MAYELAEQMDWQWPDWIIYPTGGGTGMVGMWKAFDEIERIGWVTPAQAAADGVGAGRGLRADRPRVPAGHREGRSRGRTPSTIADGLRVPRAIGDFLILRAVRESGGTALAVTDRSMVEGMLAIGKHEGVSAAPEGGAALAAIQRLVADGSIKPHESVVLFNTGGALKYLDVIADARALSSGAVTAPVTCPQSPKVTPSAFAVSSRSKSSGTVLVFPTTSSSGRATMSGGANATIVPNSPRCTSSTALPPNRVASTRSKLVGAPPRCRWPSTTDRVSFPVSPRERLAHLRADAAEPLGGAPVRRLDQRQRAALRKRAFGDDDDAELRAPLVALAQPLRRRCAMSNGISGIRIASAPPATPA